MTEPFEITYRARGGRPSVDLDLHVGADGQTDVFVGSSTSIPLARVSRIGTFAGQAPTVELEAIRAYLNEHKLVDRAGSYGEVAPSTPNRYLELTVDGQQAQFKIGEGANNSEIEGFERLLHQLALTMTDQPTRAAEASLEFREADGQITPIIELRSIGSEPMTALLFDPEKPVFTLYVHVDLQGTKTTPKGVTFPVTVGSVAFPTETVQAMAERGELPSGIAELPPGAIYRFELPAIARPEDVSAVTATGAVEFWLPDGLARRELSILTPDIALP